MSPNVAEALARFQAASKEEQERIAQLILGRLRVDRESYDQFVERRLDEGLADIERNDGVPAPEAFSALRAEMKAKYEAL